MTNVPKITPMYFFGMGAQPPSAAMNASTPSPASANGAVDSFAGVYAGNQPQPALSQEGTTPPPPPVVRDETPTAQHQYEDARRISEAAVDTKLMDMTYLEAYGSLISVYRDHPEKVETLNAFLVDGGRWGETAKQFEQALSWLEIRVREYEVLKREYKRTEDPSTLEEMGKLMLEDIAQRVSGLKASPFHRMMLAHKVAAHLARRDLLPLLETLAAVDIRSHRASAIERAGPRPVQLNLHYRGPEELREHLDGWFMGVTPPELVAVEVTVSSSQQAMRVKHAIEDAAIEITRNMDSVDGDTGLLVAKELEVVLPSGNRMPVLVRLESDDAADSTYPAAHVEPASHVRIGNKDGTSVDLTMSVQEVGAFRMWRYVTDDGRTASEFAVSGGRMARRFTDPAFERFGLVDRLERMAQESKGPN